MWYNINLDKTYSAHYEIRRDFKNISFPSTLLDSDLATQGVYPLTSVKPEASSQLVDVVEDTITLNSGSIYEQNWKEVDKFSDTTDEAGVVTTKATHEAEYTVSETAKLAAAVRVTRDSLLADTDWVVTRAKELGQPVPDEVYTYRGDLRQLPEQAGFPSEITWPNKPA